MSSNNPSLRGGSLRGKPNPEDDIYEGYNELATATDRIMSTVAAASGKSTNNGTVRRPPASGPISTQMRAPQKGTVSNNAQQQGQLARPMSSVKGAGYTSNTTGSNLTTSGVFTGQKFDPFGVANQGPAPPLLKNTQGSPELQAKELEANVNTLLEESSISLSKGDKNGSLEKAREAMKKERLLVAHRTKHNTSDQINTDLTFAVGFQLAFVYESHGMNAEALNQYSTLAKDQNHPLACRVRINMGNIHHNMHQYPQAIKMYRMALDQLGTASPSLSGKVSRNLAIAQLRQGQFLEARHTLEALLDSPRVEAQSVFNLLIAGYALGDEHAMQSTFCRLLESRDHLTPCDCSISSPFIALSQGSSSGTSQRSDDLFQDCKQRTRIFHNYILTAARLIAPVVGATIADGYDWVIDTLRTHTPANASAEAFQGDSVSCECYHKLATEVEVCKGLALLRSQDMAGAYEVFQGIQVRSTDSMGHQACNNLSCLYFLEGDFRQAEEKAEMAVRGDRYSARALVNKANIHVVKNECELAREVYLEAVGVEADCTEAIYNLGLCNIRMGLLEDALQAFKKLHRLSPADAQVVLHISNIYDRLGCGSDAVEWAKTLIGLVPNDPRAHARLGNLLCRYDRESSAAQHFLDSYHVYPVCLEVISWLGVWHVRQHSYQEAVTFFQRAADIEPHDVKWKLMIASCYRRMGDQATSLMLYKRINTLDPTSVECLKYLVALCRDMADPDLEKYATILAQLERASMMASEEPANNYYSQQQEQEMAMAMARAAAQREAADAAAAAAAEDDGGIEEEEYSPEQYIQPPANYDAQQQYQYNAPARDYQSQQQQQRQQQSSFDLPSDVGAVGSAQQGQAINNTANDQQDDWADAVLDDDMLPM